MSTSITYVCTAPDHQHRRLSDGFALTVHRDGWAYCAGGDRTEHEWVRLDHPRSIADVGYSQPQTAA